MLTQHDKVCIACDINKNGVLWRYHDGHTYCKSCYQKYVYHSPRARRVCNEYRLCKCGCNESIPIIDTWGKSHYYKYGHWLKARVTPLRIGHKREKAIGVWNGGRVKAGKYWAIIKPDHPNARSNGYVLEHRLVYEKYYNCCLLPWTIVHHIDENTTNNNIENLVAMVRGRHSPIHLTGRFRADPNRTCFRCNGKNKPQVSRGRPKWQKMDGEWVCGTCFTTLWRRKKKSIILGKV